MSLKTNCQICQSSIGSSLSAENQRKLQHCLEGLQYTELKSVVCLKCTGEFHILSDFKSIFSQLEAEFHHLVEDIAKPVNFDKVHQAGPLKKVFRKACRICFKVSKDQKLLKHNDSFITLISQCLPNCDINLTMEIYLCKMCYKKIWLFNIFLAKILPSQKQRLNSAITVYEETGKIGKPPAESSFPYLRASLPNQTIKKYNITDLNVAYKCPYCPDPVSNFADLSKHIKNHLSQKQCWKCGRFFHRMHILTKHFKSHRMMSYEILTKVKTPCKNELDFRNASHEITGLFKCIICGEIRSNLQSFHGHVLFSHMDKVVSHCSKCSLKGAFETLFDAQLHLAEVHEIYELFDISLISPVNTAVSCSQIDKSFCCGDCSSYFKDINELDQHSCTPKSSNNNQSIQSSTDGATAYTSFCTNKVFEYKDEFSKHTCKLPVSTTSLEQLVHQSKTWSCPKCHMELDTAAQVDTHQCPSCIMEEEKICQPVKFQCYNCQVELESLEELHQCATNEVQEEYLYEFLPKSGYKETSHTSIQNSNELNQTVQQQPGTLVSQAYESDPSNRICYIERVEGGYTQEHNVYLQINLQQSPYKAPSPITHNFPKNMSQDQYKNEEPYQKRKKRKYKYSKCKNNCIVVLDDDDD